ncbi:sporozoite invasion-associated protein 2, putative [Plasmodium knowlesi strain H]|uniref:Sporozoite invasion-associated protein 2, putative n=3 Tax=Plasmodium knowlesi TaxID=5850 RepID=A0A5K1V4G3_PLAKH|nr:sporozoite invasion-associated protein 2, putative [Plasmodium knowlesi strain H]OTN68164.1 putative Sporozoite invasion-associated protein 2 [Plasmodium knowlesi]CAA9990277.1 sporozoite invasion-associated protein 2, putative [Plasmodium knowlesi strain H]SBO26743.1 sporozoite invasion-associated protein 2, putative [Plasmodium knowlesi strain H]SBO28402.1 sporozoite invasion-associated protein 2, putative [Plasmodium knowlesi strain H]VVS79751.1 sporozoite invasion-associated protein 2, p|eukprot:XP_002258024.1 hypothetical protein, conserved in Plasmodium species [Plasmodium knowlesi strain H]
MLARRKYHCYNSLLIISTLLFFISTFMLCSSSQLESAPNPEPSPSSSSVYLRERYYNYSPNIEDILGPEASQIMTSLYETIDQDITTAGAYKNEPDDYQSNQSNSNEDAILLNYLSSDTDSFDDLMDEIDNHKKKKKNCSPLRKTILKKSDSCSSLSDYELDNEVLRQAKYEEDEDEDDDLLFDDPFEVIDYPWSDILEKFPHNTNHTSEDQLSSFEEVELDDPQEEMKFGKLKFFGIENPNSLKKKKTIDPTTTKRNLKKDDKKSDASHINKHEQEKLDKRECRSRRHFKNPIESFSITISYDNFLKQNNMKDHPSIHHKESAEPFALDEYNYRDARYHNVRLYVLKILHDNISALDQKEYQYLKNHKYEVEDYIKIILRNSFICLTFSQEDQLFNDAHIMIDKASMKSM